MVEAGVDGGDQGDGIDQVYATCCSIAAPHPFTPVTLSLPSPPHALTPTSPQVGNTAEVVRLVAGQAHTRVFALGLGDAASHELVEGIGEGRGCGDGGEEKVLWDDMFTLIHFIIPSLPSSFNPVMFCRSTCGAGHGAVRDVQREPGAQGGAGLRGEED